MDGGTEEMLVKGYKLPILRCISSGDLMYSVVVNNSEKKVKVLVAQSYLTLCNLVDCSSPGFSVHGILQARILEWVAIPSSRGFSQARDRTQVSHIAGGFFTI